MSHAALFARFLRFGFNAFGGPVAQIAMIRRELVEQESWIGPAAFDRLLAVMQVLPGPEAHELCVHLGIRAKGRLGGLLAGLGFMLPGLLLMLALAALYSSLALRGSGFGPLFLGVQAAVLALVGIAVVRIGRHILTDRLLWSIALAAAALTLAGVSFWLVLPAAGLACAAVSSRRPVLLLLLIPLGIAALLLPQGSGAAASSPSPGDAAPWLLFLAGLKGGLLTFGGAYTAIPFVRDDTVGRGWMSDGQFLDGVALASVLPAPLVVFATFAGWMSGGPTGALAITAGIFLPAFSFSLLFYERLEAVVDDPRLQHFLGGIAAAVVGLIAVTWGELARAAARQSPDLSVSLLIFAAALAVLATWRRAIVTPLVLACAAAAGFLLLG
jgi:chromate transporter